MKSKLRIWFAALVILLLGAGALLFWEEAERRKIATDVEKLRRDLAEKDQTLADLTDKLADARRAASRAQVSSAANPSGALLGTGAQGSTATGVEGKSEKGDTGKTIVGLLSPEFLDQMQDQMTTQRLAEIEGAVRLSPAEREEIEALLRKEASLTKDLTSRAMRGEKVDPTALAGKTVDVDEELKKLLGPSRYEDYTTSRDGKRKSQMESMFQSQFAFFARELELRPDQLSTIESVARKYGLGAFGGSAEGEDPTGWIEEAKSEEGGTVSSRTILAKMADRQKSRTAKLAEEIRGLVDPEQFQRFEQWKGTQDRQYDMMMKFVPDMEVPVPARSPTGRP